ncbi:MAG: hypothetical protein A3B47_01235 [Candidatus Levybacteria bacterium RIFCSPLOWO2_01_FULL_39_24]|nr:MAG: hypothetical protein A2800_03270 [Candidatus Levybacteria bacterium RIFCSPHIGHO2_01_FULL_40_16]OGH28612.1 MAG: hypothetical protein A3E12_03170 [Candidatus Levybacteria bacterium RIFCSPHIGHO2_12_FULL_39_9]OGH46001.1 MAG: hypothetical protein A3B47_01235 [Candidatus Levybacteria bacterium RIFCSPLOWO2_01_FULL_39_24]
MEKKGKALEANKSTEQPLVHNFNNNINNSIFTKNLFIFLIVTAIMGTMTGYILSNRDGAGGNTLTSGTIDSSKVSKGVIVGSNDIKTFKDTASGTLKNGGINGEGQFHLVRTGGDSQNVYLTSSSVDLSVFVGKKIKVWGETQRAQYAGWLMDVGRVEVAE